MARSETSAVRTSTVGVELSSAQLQARRRQIHDAARHCFQREGFHRATMLGIAREAGVSVAVLHHRFDSKENLLRAIVQVREAPR